MGRSKVDHTVTVVCETPLMPWCGGATQVILDKLEVVLDDLAEMCTSPVKARQVLPRLGAIEPSR